MDEVVITALPHPVTTFILGMVLLGLILLFVEYRGVKVQIKGFREDVSKLNDKIDHQKELIEKKIEETSKKVDSRVDKAILIFKQKLNQNK